MFSLEFSGFFRQVNFHNIRQPPKKKGLILFYILFSLMVPVPEMIKLPEIGLHEENLGSYCCS